MSAQVFTPPTFALQPQILQSPLSHLVLLHAQHETERNAELPEMLLRFGKILVMH